MGWIRQSRSRPPEAMKRKTIVATLVAYYAGIHDALAFP
jgi:hypothetical protein